MSSFPDTYSKIPRFRETKSKNVDFSTGRDPPYHVSKGEEWTVVYRYSTISRESDCIDAYALMK